MDWCMSPHGIAGPRIKVHQIRGRNVHWPDPCKILWWSDKKCPRYPHQKFVLPKKWAKIHQKCLRPASLQDSMSHCIEDVPQWTKRRATDYVQLNVLNTEYISWAPAHRHHHIPSSNVRVGPDCPSSPVCEGSRCLHRQWLDNDDSYQPCPVVVYQCTTTYTTHQAVSASRRTRHTCHQSCAAPSGLL